MTDQHQGCTPPPERAYHPPLGDHHHHLKDGTRIDHNDGCGSCHNRNHAYHIELDDRPCTCGTEPEKS